MKAMILAAGLGTRMRPLTDNCPKPLLPVAGKPLIVHHIEKLVAAGFDHIVINHAYLGFMIEAALGNGEQFGCKISYSPEEQALETAGGIINALPLLTDNGEVEEPFLLVNGDVWSSWDFQSARQKLSDDTLAHLYLVPNPEFHPDGDFVLQSHGMVCDKGQGDGTALTFSGISWLSPRLFLGMAIEKTPLAPLLRETMAKGQVTGELLSETWVDVGTPERLSQVEQLIGDNKGALNKGVLDKGMLQE